MCSDSFGIRWTFPYPLLALRIPVGAHTVLPEPAWTIEERKLSLDCVRCPWYPVMCFVHRVLEHDSSESSYLLCNRREEGCLRCSETDYKWKRRRFSVSLSISYDFELLIFYIVLMLDIYNLNVKERILF